MLGEQQHGSACRRIYGEQIKSGGCKCSCTCEDGKRRQQAHLRPDDVGNCLLRWVERLWSGRQQFERHSVDRVQARRVQRLTEAQNLFIVQRGGD